MKKLCAPQYEPVSALCAQEGQKSEFVLRLLMSYFAVTLDPIST